MRGKVDKVNNVAALTGITPAYAGKSVSNQDTRKGHKDHPRVCGEKLLHVRVPDGIVGSPPRMRGKGNSTMKRWQEAGITPAYAGKS